MLDDCKSKGTSVINTRKYLIHKMGEEKFNELADEVGLPPKVVSSSWIKIETVYQLHVLAAKELKTTPRDLGYASAAYTLVEDLNGIYKLFMRGAGVVSVLAKSPRMLKSYSNYSEAEMLQNDFGFVRVKYTFNEEFKSHLDVLDFILGSFSGGADGILHVCKYKMDSWTLIEENFDPTEPGCTAIAECKYSRI
ncbi:MAG: hypothetical protein R8G66_04325 [Cytophagales bacterium]|nr:hypothetical protein [Cytophagales bacterium]